MTDHIQKLTAEILKNPSADSYFQRATSYFEIREYDLTIQDCNEGLKLDNKNKKCYYLRISALSMLKRYDEAFAECNKSIKADSKYAPAYLGRGKIHFDQKKYDEALVEYNKAIELDPDWAYPYYYRGNVYFDQNRYDEALVEYKKAIELDPDWVYPLTSRGNVYLKQNLYEEALANYRKAIEIYPNWAYPYNGCGNVYVNQTRYGEALTEYKKAIELDPSLAYPFYNRGIVYFAQNRYDEALTEYKKAYKLYGENDGYYKSMAKNKIDEITTLLDSRKAKKDNTRKIIDETNKFQSEIDRNKKNRGDFFSHKYEVKPIDNLEFTVLRKWNSFTPIVGSGFRASKGGGYFIKNGNKGIVVDPGFNFIENFIASGHKFKEIDAVLITHAHNDHTSDLDSLLTILYKYNDDLFGSYSENKEGSIVDDVLKTLNYSIEDIKSDSAKEKVVKKANEIFKEKRKIITFYITTGVFKKYVSFFSLMKKSNYKIVCIDDENFNEFNVGKINVQVIKAKHDDMMSDASAVGFCFEYNDFALIYTGDTGFWGMDGTYQKLKDCLNEKRITRIALVANLGGFKESENSYSKEKNDEKCYYKNHLGRLGVAKLVEIIEPEICMISEFGEEFNGYRIKLADVFNDVYKESLKTVFLPADVGLCVNSKMEVLAITDATPKNSSDELTDNDGFPREFVQPSDVKVGEVDQISELYYYHKNVDAIALAKKKVAKFYESLR